MVTEPRVIAEAHLPLSRAVICPELDETIFDISFGACPVCGSRNYMPLARWLGSVREADLR